MIESIAEFTNSTSLTQFQSIVINLIAETLRRVDLHVLSEHSFVSSKKGLTTISLVHKDDCDTNVTLNVKENDVVFCYTSCIMYMCQDDFDSSNFAALLSNALLGNYHTVDFYYKNKLLLSRTGFDNDEHVCMMPISVFYKFYLRFYGSRITIKTVRFKSFLIG